MTGNLNPLTSANAESQVIFNNFYLAYKNFMTYEPQGEILTCLVGNLTSLILPKKEGVKLGTLFNCMPGQYVFSSIKWEKIVRILIAVGHSALKTPKQM